MAKHVPEPRVLATKSGNAGAGLGITTGGARQQDGAPAPVQIVSDIQPRRPPATPSAGRIAAVSSPASTASDGTRKTKYATAEERRRATSIALKQRWASGSMDHEKPAPAVAPKDEDSEYDAAEGDTSSVSSGPDVDDAQAVDDEVQATSRQGGHQPIEMATADRPYTRWRDEDGSLRVAYGTLVPEGYQLSDDIPGYPWICPIRSCRKAFAKTVQLGGHFIRAHRADPSDPPVVATTCPTSVLLRQRNGGFSEAVITVSAPPSPSPYESESSPQGDAASLWNYIEPHLVKHKGTPPAKGYVQKLLQLPRVRDLDWNAPWLAAHSFNDTNPRGISALIIQATGEPAPHPCKNCASGRGPFRSCVVISSKAGKDPLTNILSCANCFYHFGQTYCTHKLWGKARAERILSARGDPGQLDGAVDEMEVEEDEEDMDHSMAGDLPAEDGIPAGIAEAEPGRTYTDWPNAEGVMVTLHGALLPAGYEFDTSIPGRPWACPVRSCRKAFCTRGDFGFHFKRAHCASLLNDNCDGTFTVESEYRPRGECIGRGGKILINAPPVVVSRMPRKNASPPVKVQLPAYLVAMGTTATPPRAVPVADDDPTPKKLDNKETEGLWAYVQSHLVSTTERPTNMAVRELLMLPRRRDIQFNWHSRARPFSEEASRDVAALIIQVVGDEAPEPCTRCRHRKGPFEECINVPELARHTKKRYPCCGNCLYKGKKLLCSLGPGRARSGAAREVVEHEPELEPLSEPEPLPPASFPARGLRAGRSTQPPAAPSVVPSSRQPSSSSALISQGTFQGQEALLEMEDWEIAPGRIRETAPEADGDTIAFSKPYLSTPTAVPVCADVHFRVDTILSGATLQLAAEPDTTRLCSVAAGKVRVAMGSEKEFVVGPHGMFKLRAGVGCVVRNGMYLDAVVHTVVLAGFE
ncbi:hypothetical protein C8A05DRAFT_30204 [Staphylotrichum tortipilum]|uniref:C2H2-type domain-containing protein n=1 Tax=Staphylotrichum tortipilum TaxID=2831512 RepID=A0AAN6MUN7_9PEZI|nr:hypothetical protein C8A05DRAFT_30204 [Staphylotrichum longicolle]